MSNEALAGYAKYDSYKDSGVDWLGEVPEEWEVIKLKHLVNIKNGFAFPSEDYTHEGIALIRIGDLLSNGSVSLEKAPRLPNKYSKYIPEYSVKYGDMLMAMTGGTIGKVSINRTKVNSLLNQRVCNIVPSAKFHSELAWFWINSGYWKQHIEYKSFGGAQPNISDTQIKEMYIVIPHLNVQSVIAKFLYYKTDQIDQAITLKQQQIEKLNEYMQITIQNAVTKGLDANAKMKDSGI